MNSRSLGLFFHFFKLFSTIIDAKNHQIYSPGDQNSGSPALFERLATMIIGFHLLFYQYYFITSPSAKCIKVHSGPGKQEKPGKYKFVKITGKTGMHTSN